MGGGVFIDARGGENHYANDSDANLTLLNNTIAKNSVTVGSTTGAQRSGAGVYLSTTGITDNPFDVTIGNNLIAGNLGAEDAIALLGSSFNITNLGHNLFGSTTGLSGVVNGQNGDLVGADARLGTLGDHGGPTQTLSILYGSPAIDAGDDITAPSTDQRGTSRVGASDIGAYEWLNTAPTWPTQSLNSSRVGAAYVGSVSASDIDVGQILTISMIDAPLFVSFVDNGDGTGTILGTPALSDFGSHQITLRVSDGTTSADVMVTLVVRNSLHVLNTDDSGPGSLRQSIADAGAGDTVDLTNITGTIVLLSPLTLTQEVTVLGSGRNSLTLSGNDLTSIFIIGDETTDADVTITDLTLADGVAEHGGAIYLAHGVALNLSRVRITSSHATANGGAIASADASSSMTLVDCLIDHNSAGRMGGGILAAGDAGFTRTTISYNTIAATADESDIASGGGAGLALIDGTHTLLNSTIANNSITTAAAQTRIAEGAGLLVHNSTLSMIGVTIALNAVDVNENGSGFSVASGFEPTLTIRNSLIAGNSGSVDASWAAFSSASVVSHTLIARMQTNALAQHGVNGCQVGTVSNPINAKLGSLDDNGGLVPTIRLRKGSPAINAGSSEYASAADQRGTPREGQPDLGAFEYVPPTNLSPTWVTHALDSATTSVPYSLTISATDANPDETLSLSLISGPAFLQLSDNGDGTATLVGTPTLAHVGTHSVQLRVSDGTAFTTLYTSLTVAASLAELDEGTLYINGTNGNDVIDALLVAPGTVRVTRGSTVRTFALGGISRIVVNGFGGNDSLKAQINRLPATIYGGSGNDTIRGGGGDDQLMGESGDDYIDTGAGRNKAYGGEGNDTLTGGNSADRLSGEDGADLINGRGGPDILYGGDGNDYIDTASDRNRAYGGDGNDTLVGGNSADRLYGDRGDDSLIGARGKDFLAGGDGTDRARVDATDLLDSIEIIV
jgi:Ca2+-binding RTX toxin-like protein